MTRWALEITWLNGGQEYLVDLQRSDRRVKEFQTPAAAKAHRDAMLRRSASRQMSAIDVVPYPEPPAGRRGAAEEE